MTSIDETHDATRQSFVRSANGHPDFPIQNLPLGVFSRAQMKRGVVLTGDRILDLGAAVDSGFAGEAARAAQAASYESQAFLRSAPMRAVRCADVARAAACSGCGLHHACAGAGRGLHRFLRRYSSRNQCRQAIAPTTLCCPTQHLPVGWHGRASSICPSGAAVRRPYGQRKPPNADAPLRPSQRLDYELSWHLDRTWELLGELIPIATPAARRGLLPAQRLVCARHSGLGIPAAGAVFG